MTTAMTAPDAQVLSGSAVEKTVADRLNAHGFEVRSFTSQTRCHLKVVNVRSTVADLTIAADGTADWQYCRFDGNPPDPARLNAIMLAILLGDDAPAGPAEDGHLAHMSLLGNICATAIEHGLSASVSLVNPASTLFALFDQVTITNPAQPHRGTVYITDDVCLWWRSHACTQPHNTGYLELTEIAATIAQALTNANTVRPEPQH